MKCPSQLVINKKLNKIPLQNSLFLWFWKWYYTIPANTINAPTNCRNESRSSKKKYAKTMVEIGPILPIIEINRPNANFEKLNYKLKKIN